MYFFSLIVRPVIVHSCKNITSRVPWMNAWIHQLTNEITRHTMRHINSNHVTKHKTPNYYLRAEGGGGRLSSSANISFFYCANNNNISNYRNRGQIKKRTQLSLMDVVYYTILVSLQSDPYVHVQMFNFLLKIKHFPRTLTDRISQLLMITWPSTHAEQLSSSESNRRVHCVMQSPSTNIM